MKPDNLQFLIVRKAYYRLKALSRTYNKTAIHLPGLHITWILFHLERDPLSFKWVKKFHRIGIHIVSMKNLKTSFIFELNS